MVKRQAEAPRVKLKTGFYQQYRYDRRGRAGSGFSLFRWDEKRKEWAVKIVGRTGKAIYYMALFFLCSVGVTALLNAAIRQILLESLFGAGG